ncbi:enoyl-CoA hydratase/isomerase family protein [Nocardioides mangrovicus]|uniref:Enoyl-CoA hydratase/isomerase family protein n=1 Tax=Nocardioides mangrovicus TaxID=2478913 RepID=A0A3L8P005_9ACTN|nr:enoyl-CoA hydratase/isomerase family protein [Nocardioides mangrovicus]RLV48765.1 enoyl-CoA hydratase/isomerase family protein [Nocardioides mangrovicus]
MLPDADTLARAGLAVTVAGEVLTVTLDRPAKRNAMTPGMWHALADVGAALPAEVRVVVVKGAGEAFSAGLDRAMLTPEGPEGESGFGELLAHTDEEVRAEISRYQDGFVWLADPRIVSIAQVHGYAIGGGFQLALACDLRVVADDVRFAMREPALGMVPDLAGTKPLVSAVGYARALEICATSRFVAATEAQAIGLVNQVVPKDELDTTVAGLVTALLANPHDAVAGTKALLQGAGVRSLTEQREAERTAQVPLLRRLAGG